MMPELQVTSPAFSLFQRVRSNYHWEDCHQTDDRGIVIGLFYQWSEHCQMNYSGWIYYVYWFNLPSSPWLALPYIDETIETDLVPDELSSVG